MSASVQHVFLCAGIAYVIVGFMNTMLHGGFCLSCGGHGKHRDDCPEK